MQSIDLLLHNPENIMRNYDVKSLVVRRDAHYRIIMMHRLSTLRLFEMAVKLYTDMDPRAIQISFGNATGLEEIAVEAVTLSTTTSTLFRANPTNRLFYKLKDPTRFNYFNILKEKGFQIEKGRASRNGTMCYVRGENYVVTTQDPQSESFAHCLLPTPNTYLHQVYLQNNNSRFGWK